jgi:hypothetical protein
MVKAIKARKTCMALGHKWAPAEGYTREGTWLDECQRCGRKVWRERGLDYVSYQYDGPPRWWQWVKGVMAVILVTTVVLFLLAVAWSLLLP